MSNQTLQWLPLRAAELDEVGRIAGQIHPGLPERREVFAEKLSLSPATCLKAVLNGELVGYGVSHPWMLFAIPPLDSYLTQIPDRCDCMYVHDVALLQRARGQNAAGAYLTIIRRVAQSLGLRKLACVSVYGTSVLWAQHGFVSHDSHGVQAKLASYGADAKYMIADVGL